MRKYKPILYGTIITCLFLGLTTVNVYNRYNTFKALENKALYNEALNAKSRLENCLYHAIAPAQTLKFIIDYYGIPEDFNATGQALIKDNKCVSAIQLVENGIITKIYPLHNNESVIGYNILKDGSRNKEAFKAIASRQIYFAGPLKLKQGGVGIIGRVPYFAKERFAGFAAVIIEIETLLKTAQLINSEKSNYSYQLSKINPNSGVREFFMGENLGNKKVANVTLKLPMGEWLLAVEAKNPVSLFHFNYLIIFGIILSFSAGLLTISMLYLPKKLEKKVEERTDQIRKHEVSLIKNLREIEKQNMQLMEIAWIQSHKFRAPLARILGLISIYKFTKIEEERNNVIENLEKSALELDQVIHEITSKSDGIKGIDKK